MCIDSVLGATTLLDNAMQITRANSEEESQDRNFSGYSSQPHKSASLKIRIRAPKGVPHLGAQFGNLTSIHYCSNILSTHSCIGAFSSFVLSPCPYTCKRNDFVSLGVDPSC